jgi:hypothetical protein
MTGIGDVAPELHVALDEVDFHMAELVLQRSGSEGAPSVRLNFSFRIHRSQQIRARVGQLAKRFSFVL